MEVKIPKEYYRKYDSMCFKLASNFEEYEPYTDKKFIQWVQDERVARIVYGTEKYGAISRYSEPYMFGATLRKCKQKVQRYMLNTAKLKDEDKQENPESMLFDALNYLMIEYLTRFYTYKPLDELDVLTVFYRITMSECETFEDAVNEMLDVYTDFYEYGYLMLASLVIYSELYNVWKGRM